MVRYTRSISARKASTKARAVAGSHSSSGRWRTPKRAAVSKRAAVLLGWLIPSTAYRTASPSAARICRNGVPELGTGSARRSKCASR
ncbi:Uncharacterised protein [Mycobacteroides abscessus subsp. abscessus]|nr:Uncharacterised protein [Mycobacteroides abscessus subsp. abscessus]